MKRSGSADLPLHYGYVPRWLAERMARLGLAISEAIIIEYGKTELIRRLADPFWFQSLGAVMGMDWHSSGVTTSVMGALKRAINPRAKDLGVFICGGKGKYSTETPAELLKIADMTGLDGTALVQCSKLSAKVDNTAVQDGFQLYTHNFILTNTGEWTVVQQGMREGDRTARRYHWHSENIISFTEEPHTGICGRNQGIILNLTDRQAQPTKAAMVSMAGEEAGKIIREFQHLVMPSHHEVFEGDVDLKRLGSVLWLAHEQGINGFEDLLMMQGVGPRTLQSLALVSEVVYGTPARFRDPARFSFAHGGKDGHPFPVPTKVYDETIDILNNALQKAKLGLSDKQEAIRKLHTIAAAKENDFVPSGNLDDLIQKERDDSWKYGGRTVFGKVKPPVDGGAQQLRLFE